MNDAPGPRTAFHPELDPLANATLQFEEAAERLKLDSGLPSGRSTRSSSGASARSGRLPARAARRPSGT